MSSSQYQYMNLTSKLAISATVLGATLLYLFLGSSEIDALTPLDPEKLAKTPAPASPEQPPSPTMPEKAKEMEALLHAHLKEIDAQIPVLNKEYDPATDPALNKGGKKKKGDKKK